MKTQPNEFLVDRLVDILERIGCAANGLPADWILLADIDDLQAIKPAATRRRLLMAAKEELLRRYLDEVLGPDATVYVDEDAVNLDELEPGVRDVRLLAEIDNIVDMMEHIRRTYAEKDIDHHDCFSEDVRRDCERFKIAIWGKDAPSARVAAPEARAGLVYFVSSGDATAIKIGFTTSIKHRLRSLRTASPNEVIVHLTLPGGRELEQELHARFHADRIEREWFRLSAELRAFIETEKVKATGAKPG